MDFWNDLWKDCDASTVSIFFFLVSLTILPPGHLLSFSFEPWCKIINFQKGIIETYSNNYV